MPDLESLTARVCEEGLAEFVGAMAVYPLSPLLQKALTIRVRTDDVLSLATVRNGYTCVLAL